MDAKRVAEGYLLTISPTEARELSEFVDRCTYWDMIASRENRRSMIFMLDFRRDLVLSEQGMPAYEYPIRNGQVLISRENLATLAAFYKATIEVEGHRMKWMYRMALTLQYKTLQNRI